MERDFVCHPSSAADHNTVYFSASLPEKIPEIETGKGIKEAQKKPPLKTAGEQLKTQALFGGPVVNIYRTPAFIETSVNPVFYRLKTY
jgi:hypothetical protein